MSNEKETIEDIVADIRAQNQGLPEDGYALSPLVCDLLSFADRIEAAYKRLSVPTPEQWTEIARNGSEIADLKRENDALKRKLEAGAEAAQICGEIGEMVGREAGCHKPVTDCHGLNAAAMRETLLRCDAMAQMPEIREYTIVKEMRNLIKKALAAPPRN